MSWATGFNHSLDGLGRGDCQDCFHSPGRCTGSQRTKRGHFALTGQRHTGHCSHIVTFEQLFERVVGEEADACFQTSSRNLGSSSRIQANDPLGLDCLAENGYDFLALQSVNTSPTDDKLTASPLSCALVLTNSAGYVAPPSTQPATTPATIESNDVCFVLDVADIVCGRERKVDNAASLHHQHYIAVEHSFTDSFRRVE